MHRAPPSPTEGAPPPLAPHHRGLDSQT
jgi:hypothetical protein